MGKVATVNRVTVSIVVLDGTEDDRAPGNYPQQLPETVKGITSIIEHHGFSSISALPFPNQERLVDDVFACQ
jgi:hypothetical protein